MTERARKIARLLHGRATVRVLFVCLGNICRSPAAEGVLRAIVEREGATDRWEIDSCGIGDWHVGDLPDHRMRQHARHRGYELTHRARQVRTSDFDDFDLIVPMDASNAQALRSLAPSPEAMDKIVPLMDFADRAPLDHVPDPYYEGAEGFELVLDLLESTLANLYQSL